MTSYTQGPSGKSLKKLKANSGAQVLHSSSTSGLILHGGNKDDCLHSPLVIALVPFKFSRNLQFPQRVPLTKEKMPWCPCPFKNEAYRHVSFLSLIFLGVETNKSSQVSWRNLSREDDNKFVWWRREAIWKPNITDWTFVNVFFLPNPHVRL